MAESKPETRVDDLHHSKQVDTSEERAKHAKDAQAWKEKQEAEAKAREKEAEPLPDPYAIVPAPGAGYVPHEDAVGPKGTVPLPPGHPRNPPGSIPRAPGEWPTGQMPPENPLGKRETALQRPGGEDYATQVEKKLRSILEEEKAEEGKRPGTIPGSDEEKQIKKEAVEKMAKDVAPAKR
jgi:hypothetical protein